MKVILIRAIYLFSNILVTALVVRALMSWFVRDTYSTAGKIYAALIRFTEPLVSPFRRLLSNFNTGMLDFSVLLAIVVIEMIGNLLVRLVILL